MKNLFTIQNAQKRGIKCTTLKDLAKPTLFGKNLVADNWSQINPFTFAKALEKPFEVLKKQKDGSLLRGYSNSVIYKKIENKWVQLYTCNFRVEIAPIEIEKPTVEELNSIFTLNLLRFERFSKLQKVDEGFKRVSTSKLKKLIKAANL